MIAELTSSGELSWSGGPKLSEEAVRMQIGPHSVWFQGATAEQLDDACLGRAARSLETEVSSLSFLIAHVLTCIKASAGKNRPWELKEEERRTDLEWCHHAVFVDDRVCPTLTFTNVGGDKVGAINVADLLCDVAPKEICALARLPVKLDLLEAAPDEPTLSYEEMMALDRWSPANCETLRPARPWKHLILVSHHWGGKAPTEDWPTIKRRVAAYIQDHLRDPERNPRIKAKTAEDFGIWVDYMMVPNDPTHELRKCDACRENKVRMIQRISALLTLATVLPMSQDDIDRGWVLQEMSLDTHGATKFEHRDRVSLMAQHVDFASNLSHEINDGLMLRCNEFVRLALTPRVWPSVNVALLKSLAEHQMHDESRDDAWQILTTLARSFGAECHLVKAQMADLTQAAAMGRDGQGTIDSPIPLGELLRGVKAQAEAMNELSARIREGNRPGIGRAVAEAREQLQALMTKLHDQPDMARKIGPAWTAYREALTKLPDGRTDPEGGLVRVPIAERIHLTERLQVQQFIAVAMGLRAEWLRGAGLAAWVRATAITEALCGTKFMGRLQSGQVRFSMASGPTLKEKPRELQVRAEFAKEVATRGVSVTELEAVYALGEEWKKKIDLKKATKGRP